MNAGENLKKILKEGMKSIQGGGPLYVLFSAHVFSRRVLLIP